MAKVYADTIIDLAKKELGTVEKPVNKVKYNTWFYGKKVSGNDYPWCASFMSWLFYMADALSLIGGKSASCSQMIDRFKSKGQWHSKPKVGDLVFFTFSHVELVVEVHDGYIITIGGNTSPDTSADKSVSAQRNGGGVYLRKRSSSIKGYGRPKYDKRPIVSISTRCRLYKQPTKTKGFYEALPVGKDITFIEDMGNGWSKIKCAINCGIYTGYAKNSCIKKNGLSVYRTAKVKTKTAPVRIRNKKMSKKIDTLLSGTIVTVVSVGKFWTNVKYTKDNKSIDGFIFTNKLNIKGK